MNVLKNWNVRLTELPAADVMRVRGLFWLSAALSVLYSIFIPLRYFADPLPDIQRNLMILCFLLNAVAWCAAFISPQKKFGRIVFLLGIIILMSAAGFFNGGILAPSFPFVVLLPILGGFLNGRKGALVVGLISLVLLTVFFLAGNLGFLPEPKISDPLIKSRVTYVVFLGLSLLSLAVAVIYENLQIKALAASVKTSELETLKAMVVTYNHEINNPLTVAMVNLELLNSLGKHDPKKIRKIEESLNRIKNVTSLLQGISENIEVQKEIYQGDVMMMKLK